MVALARQLEGRAQHFMPSDSLNLRVISSLVLIPVVLVAAYIGGWAFTALVSAACFLMTFEWTRMVQRRAWSREFYVLAASTAGAMAAAGFDAFALALITAIIGGVSVMAMSRRPAGWDVWPAIAVPYLIIPSIALIWLRTDLENGRFLAFLLFASVWAGDIGAYTFGKLIGGPKVNPALSPAKTWAGIGGGIFAGGLAGAIMGGAVIGPGSIIGYFLIGGFLGGASVFGDMVESGLKRHFGVKDISGIIPGHGGALDRMDGMIFATMAMTAALLIYMLPAKI